MSCIMIVMVFNTNSDYDGYGDDISDYDGDVDTNIVITTRVGFAGTR